MSFSCAFCGNRVASDKGWDGVVPGPQVVARIRICPDCSAPTFFEGGRQVPGIPYGNVVRHLPDDIEELYAEARAAIAAGAPTAAVLCCRKLLMHIAVERGAKEDQNFVSYVQYLEEKNCIPVGAKAWVDQIRIKGNETNHQIQIKTQEDGMEMIDFTEMLLKVIYDYPSRVPVVGLEKKLE
jgi:hypothetical protein